MPIAYRKVYDESEGQWWNQPYEISQAELDEQEAAKNPKVPKQTDLFQQLTTKYDAAGNYNTLYNDDAAFNAALNKLTAAAPAGYELASLGVGGNDKYGGYAGHPNIVSLIDRVGVMHNGSLYLPAGTNAEINKYGESLSVDPISPKMAFLAPLAIAGGGAISALSGAGGAGTAGLTGAFDMGGLAGTGIPEAWGITGAAPSIAGTAGIETLSGGAGTDAVATAGGAGAFPSTAAEIAAANEAAAAAIGETVATGTSGAGAGGITDGILEQLLQAYQSVPPGLTTAAQALANGGGDTPGVGDAGSFDQSGSTGTGLPGSGPATSNAAGGPAGTLTPGVQSAINRILNGGGTVDDLKAALPYLLAGAGLLENPDRSTTTQTTYPAWYNRGAESAVALADQFAALGQGAVAPLSANENQAVSLASTGAGGWQPYMDRAATLTDRGALPITEMDLDSYMNPYLENVLAPLERKHAQTMSGRKATLDAGAGMKGAFGNSRNLIENSLLTEAGDAELNRIRGDTYKGAFDFAVGAANKDADRASSAGKTFGSLGTTYSNLVGDDVSRLTSTGALPRNIEQAKLNAPATASQVYAGALRGTGTGGGTRVETAPEPSKLGQATGALTAILGAQKAGIIP